MKKLGLRALFAGAIALMWLWLAGITSTTSAQFSPGNQIGIGVPGTDQDQGGNLLQVVKNFINWVLGILGFITLVVLLYGGFQMVTAAGDEDKYNSGFKILKQAGIWLVFVWLAWFVISIIFFLINTVTA